MHYFRALSRFSADSEYSQNGSQNSAKSEKVATQVNSAKKKKSIEWGSEPTVYQAPSFPKSFELSICVIRSTQCLIRKFASAKPVLQTPMQLASFQVRTNSLSFRKL